MNPNDLVTYFSFAVALVAGGGFGLQRQRVSALRADLDDARARVGDLREDLSAEKQDRVADEARITRLESDLRHAEAMALRESKWADLDKHLDEHHQQAMKAWRELRAAIVARDGKL